MYYHNNTKINTPSGLAVTDLKYNKHNVCLMKEIVFGVPGFTLQPNSLILWGNASNNGSRTILFWRALGECKRCRIKFRLDRTSLVKVGLLT